MTTLSAPNPFSTDLPPAQTPSLLDDQCVDMKFIRMRGKPRRSEAVAKGAML